MGLLDFFLPTKIKMAVDIEAGREEVGEESVTQVEEENDEVEEVTEDAGDGEPEEEEEAAADAGEDDGNEEGGDEDGEEGDEEEEEEEEEEDEEDAIDPQDVLNESCSNTVACKTLYKEFEKCEERVTSRSKTEEVCLPEYLDFIKCRDKCVARDLFSKLK